MALITQYYYYTSTPNFKKRASCIIVDYCSLRAPPMQPNISIRQQLLLLAVSTVLYCTVDDSHGSLLFEFCMHVSCSRLDNQVPNVKSFSGR